jgi:hypothetical protein
MDLQRTADSVLTVCLSQGTTALLCLAQQVYVQKRFLSAIVSLTFEAAVRAAHLPREVAFASRMTPADTSTDSKI